MEQAPTVVSKETLNKLCCSICNCFLSVPPITIISLDGKKYKCGRCSFVETEVNIPATLYEHFSSTMEFPCIHVNCEKVIPWNEVKSHEDLCAYQQVRCPCGKRMELHNIDAHVRDGHQIMMSEESLMLEKPTGLLTAMIKKNNHFFVVYVMCERDADFKVGVYNIKGNKKRYKFDLTISTNSSMHKITIPNQKIPKFNVREHCVRCLSRQCHVVYHKYQNEARHPLSGMTSVCIRASSVFEVLDSENFSLTITVTDKNDRARLEAHYARNEHVPESWKCHICQNYLRAPIYICYTGRSLCAICKDNTTICPRCGWEIGNVRNCTLESMLEHTRLMCGFQADGYGYNGNVRQVAKYERICGICSDPYQPATKKARVNMKEGGAGSVLESPPHWYKFVPVTVEPVNPDEYCRFGCFT